MKLTDRDLHREIFGQRAESVSAELREGMNKALDSLQPRIALAIRLRFLESMSLTEVGARIPNGRDPKKIGITADQAKQLISKGLWKLSDPSVAQSLVHLVQKPKTGEDWAELLRKKMDAIAKNLASKDYPLTPATVAHLIVEHLKTENGR